jgi:hypothetical protein
MFTRGETQAIAVVTLGGEADAQRIDGLGDTEKFRRFYLNYFFPPSCVGEVRRSAHAFEEPRLTHPATASGWAHERAVAPRAGPRQPRGACAAADAAFSG